MKKLVLAVMIAGVSGGVMANETAETSFVSQNPNTCSFVADKSEARFGQDVTFTVKRNGFDWSEATTSISNAISINDKGTEAPIENDGLYVLSVDDANVSFATLNDAQKTNTAQRKVSVDFAEGLTEGQDGGFHEVKLTLEAACN